MLKLISLFFAAATLAANHTSDGNCDLAASAVQVHSTTMGGRYFSYTVKNVGNEPVEGGQYQVLFKVNGRLVSFDKSTTLLNPDESIEYTSGRVFYPSKNKQRLYYQLEVRTRDVDVRNNLLIGTSKFQ